MSKYEIKKISTKLWALYDVDENCWLSSMTKDYESLLKLKEYYEAKDKEKPKSYQMKLDI